MPIKSENQFSSKTTTTKYKVAVPQVEPEWLDLEAGIARSIELIEEAAKNGASLIAFPELWIPGYPNFLWGGTFNDCIPLVKRYYENSIERDSVHLEKIRNAAAANKIFVVFGYAERMKSSLYMAQTFINEYGKVVLHRHKSKPTHVERTLFGESTGDSVMNVVESSFGKVGALQCWEHLQPLIKYHTMSQGEQIHIAAWPTNHPWQKIEPFNFSNDAAKIASQMYAIESQAYVLVPTQTVGPKAERAFSGDHFKSHMTIHGGGHAAIYGPDGRKLTKEIADTWEGMLYADVDLSLIHNAKSVADASGHYSRPDLFQLLVDNKSKNHIVYKGEKNIGYCSLESFPELDHYEEADEEL